MSKIFDGDDAFNWTKAFAEQVLTPEEAAAAVENGDSLACSLPEPTGFLYALANRTELREITIFIPAPRKGGVAIAKHPGIELKTPFLTQIMRDANAHAEVVPVRLEDWGSFTKRNASRISIVQVGRPRPDGSIAPGSAIAGMTLSSEKIDRKTISFSL